MFLQPGSPLATNLVYRTTSLRHSSWSSGAQTALHSQLFLIPVLPDLFHNIRVLFGSYALLLYGN